jgi:hypothetical protein
MLDHPWIVVVFVLVLVILLLPYEVVHFTRAGRVYHRWLGLLWSWERGPKTMRLRLSGLLRLQRALLKLIQWIWQQYRDQLWRGIREMLKQWIA